MSNATTGAKARTDSRGLRGAESAALPRHCIIRTRHVAFLKPLSDDLWPIADIGLTYHLWNRYKFITLGFVASDEAIGSDDGLGAVCAQLLVSAVVQEDDVAAANLV